MSEHDVLVIGGGAGGLSAALVLLRARRTVVVLDGGAPRNAPAAHMHGFLSRDGVAPGPRLPHVEARHPDQSEEAHRARGDVDELPLGRGH